MSRYSLTLTLALLTILAACSAPGPQPPGEARNDAKTDAALIDNLPLPPPPPLMAEPTAAAPQAPAGSVAERRQVESIAPAMKARRAAPLLAYAAQDRAQWLPPPADRENYAHQDDNPLHRVAEQPVSTFSIDVDTGSYANMRRFLNEGRLPPADAVRVEELVNYFDLAGPPARSLDTPFSVATELAPTPWNSKIHLLRVGIKGYLPQGPLPPSNLVFLVDVSGSMNEPDKLPLVKSALKLLTRQLKDSDRISLVTYAGNTAVLLEPTAGSEKATIEQAIDRLDAGGSTNGAGGIQLAYQQAQKAFLKGGNNRILLATDGDFNVGVTRFESLLDLVKEKRKAGVALTTLGFGTGNYNDRLMEQLADAGDGNYSYIDSLQEAQKVLVAQRAATLLTIARDVKIQVEFNPARVSEYRLIGYENRALQREDFSNDAVDAGDIGAGHSVTALYELSYVGEGGDRVGALRYRSEAPVARKGDELAFVRLRYKRPEASTSRLIEQPVTLAAGHARLDDASPQLRLAAAVAAFGQKLRGGSYTGGYGYSDISALARAARNADAGESVSEFLQLVSLADGLSTQAANRPAPEPVLE